MDVDHVVRRGVVEGQEPGVAGRRDVVGTGVLAAALILASGCSADPAPPPPDVTPAPAPTAVTTSAPMPSGRATTTEEAIARGIELVGLIDERGLAATGPEWDAARARALSEIGSARSVGGVSVALGRAVQLGGGPGSVLIDGGAEGTPGDARAATIAHFGGITTLGLAGDRRVDVDAVGRAVTSHRPRTCGWVIDLRESTSTQVTSLLAALSMFLDDGRLLTVVDRTGRPLGEVTLAEGTATTETEPMDRMDHRWVASVRPAVPRITDPVAVLVGPGTIGGDEVVAAVLGAEKGTRLFGRQTFGVPTLVLGTDGPEDSLLALAVATFRDRTDADLGTRPVTPDVDTGTPLEDALDWFAAHGCSATVERSGG